jgi:FMN phosphatase YigB (HAD superfamily)
MRETLNVLIVSGGSLQGLTLVKELTESPIVRVVVADCYEEALGDYFADAFYTVPFVARPADLLARLEEICERERVRVVFPSTDHELDFLAGHREPLERAGARVAVSERSLLATVRDKRSLYAALRAEGLPVLPDVDIRRAATSDFPLLGKPVGGWGGRGILVFDCASELEGHDLDALAATHVWQPRLARFDEFSVDFAVAFDGSVSRPVVRRRVRTSGGFATITDAAEHPAAEEAATRVARWASARGGRGIFNVQVLDSDGRLAVSDFNPRVGTSAVLGPRTGVNLALFVCASVAPEAGRAAAPRRAGPVRAVRYLAERFLEPTRRVPASGVVFDLDDTLVDQKRWIFDKLLLTWEALRARLPDRERFLEAALRVLEEGNRARLLDGVGDELGLARATVADLIEAYRAALPATCELYPDALPSIVTLRALGFRLGVLTDNPPASQRAKLRAAGIADAFDAVVFSREAGLEKPDGAAFAAMASALHLAPSRLAAVGDNLYRDVLGALRAGYASAFLVRREGGFFNFQTDFLGPALGRDCVAVDSLRELRHYLVLEPVTANPPDSER